MKNIRVFYLKISVFGGEIVYIFESACFRNDRCIRDGSTKALQDEPSHHLH